jgi:hypothetical protein
LSDIINVDTLTGLRFATALELLREGGGFHYERATFLFEPTAVLRCVVESSWPTEHVSRAIAEDDLAFAEAVLLKFSALRRSSPRVPCGPARSRRAARLKRASMF